MDLYRQGDIALVRVSEIPRRARRKHSGRKITVALGEVTGHAHVLEGEHVEEHTIADQRFLEIVEANAFLRHEEHASIELKPGVYRVVRQTEYEPGEIRRIVAD